MCVCASTSASFPYSLETKGIIPTHFIFGGLGLIDLVGRLDHASLKLIIYKSTIYIMLYITIIVPLTFACGHHQMAYNRHESSEYNRNPPKYTPANDIKIIEIWGS